MYKSDLFISLDTVQYVSREWQNRQIFYDNGKYKWLSVPVKKGREAIGNRKIVNPETLKDHWEYIKHTYRKCPYFEDYSDYLEHLYLKQWSYLNDLCDALTLLAKDIFMILTIFIKNN